MGPGNERRNTDVATLTVLKFQTADGAQQGLDIIQDLSRKHLITLQDAAIVTWPEGKKKPNTKQLYNLAGMGALDGAFWGMLFGLIFFVPFFGAAIGAAIGALTGSMGDVGISDEFIQKVRNEVTQGTSALFLMTSNATIDKVADAMRQLDFEVMTTNLSQEQEEKLRQAFVHEEA
jgi:uncharacterized membrane protein